MPTVLVGTADGLHAFGAERRAELAGHEVTALAREDSRWWAILDGRTICRSDGPDRGWTEAGALEPLRANCLFPGAAGLLVGSSEAHLFRLAGGMVDLIGSFEDVRGREAWHTPWGGPPDTRSISGDRAGALYVNVHVGGVVRSTDGGGSWQPTIDIHADVHQVLAHRGSDVVLAATARGLASSEDGGESWTFAREGLHATYSRAVAVAGATILVSASDGPSGRRAAVYRTPLGRREPLERCRDGLPEWLADNVDTYCLATSGSMAVFGTTDGSLYRSNDEGTSWALLTSDLPAVRCVAIA
jgi:hypothetical protein